MFPEEQAELLAARAPGRRVVLEPFMHEPVRAAHELRAAATRPHIAEQRVRTHARGRGERAQVVRIDMPAARRYAPFASARECEKEGSNALRLVEALALEHGIDCRAQTHTADGLKYR